ncbi:hypothetical protein Pcar_3156 [Syntrophotalea carbinolica DSM 2380]|uniref:Uncharacterized protein n=1 Tax=Syntrophotalea carbinolica (strain DSM 2380 / NBRC 103641 / GraBd1) TaxID=338963 RepID=Q0C710_SYNC1|nr:hypothetical protein [Syntrophotalea carbinolica]ABI81777.1 hypothetical protein Pcar_3156 [Syntrophotalea carbinolica DSM 2380]
MELYKLNNKWSKLLIWSLCVIVIFLLLSFAIFANKILLPSLSAKTPEVRANIQKVLTAKFLSEFSGGYWENVLVDRGKAIKRLPLEDRLYFYRLVLLNCYLDTSSALMFIEIIGNDALQFKIHLIKFQEDPTFMKLSQREQELVISWIREMDIIVEQKRANLTP